MKNSPSYESVCSGKTGHAEVVSIEFENDKINLTEILDIFWQVHDPTTLNRQGNDIGSQYRSVVYFTDEQQLDIVLQSIKEMNSSKNYDSNIVTEIGKLEKFYEAEIHHQDYYNNNSNQPYCSFVIHPKIKKFEEFYKK
mgnify:CR=1 FL=1